MKTASVTVEQRNIEQAQAHAVARHEPICATSPMALAIREAGYPTAYIMPREWMPAFDEEAKFLPLPDDAIAWIRDFDAGRPVAVPQTFILPLE